MAAVVLASLLVAPSSEAQEKRIALVIGNGTYAEINSLDNSSNDARLMRATLQALGFEVIYRENVDKRSMEKAIGDFATKLYESGRDTVSLVYYAGHGVQSNGENFLLPVDVPLRRETDLRLNAIRAGDILAQMEGAQARVKIVILDACRDNPFELTFRSTTRSGGLADMRLGNTEFFIAYAATAGNVAWDGDGDAKNSPYAVALAKNLPMIDTEISEVFRFIRNDVANTTRGRQLPEARTTLRSQFYFNPQSKAALVASNGGAAAPVVPLATPPGTFAPAPVVVARDPAANPVPPVDRQWSQGAPITLASLSGKWCSINRNGSDLDLRFGPGRVEHLISGTSKVYRVKSTLQPRPDILQITMQDKTPDAEFGEMEPGGKAVTWLRVRNGSGEWQVFDRRYKKC